MVRQYQRSASVPTSRIWWSPAATQDSEAKGLTANWAGLWRYRVGDHRVICQLEDDRLLVLVVRIAHRSDGGLHVGGNVEDAAGAWGEGGLRSRPEGAGACRVGWDRCCHRLSELAMVSRTTARFRPLAV
jgi:hypothetical protein